MTYETKMAYIGKKPCGCVVAATVDDGKTPKATANDVRDFIRSGYTVERVPLADVKLKRCNCAHSSIAQDQR